MTAPNHIVGGIAITGISLSFWDINIFSNSIYLSLCIFCSLLPDIDHTKSVIGKTFYPISKYLYKNYGHRTITHSLTALVPLFIFFCFTELNLINPYYERTGIDFSLIVLFAYLSHLILDMLTVAGIPLFYPFLKNKCVIPANPSLRFRSGNIKSEAIALFIFTFVLFTSYDLFENGFWTSYNRTFGTIKHAHREFKSSEFIVGVEYNYSYNGEEKKGTGYIIDATENKIDLWIDNQKRILKIDEKDNRIKNINVKPWKTKEKYKVIDLSFYDLTIQQLNDTLKNKIVSGKIISSNKFLVNNNFTGKGSVKLEKEISPKFKWKENDSINNNIRNKINLKRIKLQEIERHNFAEKNKLKKLNNYLFQLELNLQNAKDIYTKNKFEKLIIVQQKKINNFKPNLKLKEQLIFEIYVLEKEMNFKEKHYFTGDLKIYFVPKNDDNFTANNYEY